MKSSTCPGHAVHLSERSDTSEIIIPQVVGMGKGELSLRCDSLGELTDRRCGPDDCGLPIMEWECLINYIYKSTLAHLTFGDEFQFPVRNSAGLDPFAVVVQIAKMAVSIPRSEFSWFGLPRSR